MTKEEFIEAPVGTQFRLRPNKVCPLAIWEFIPCCSPVKLTEEQLYERNLIKAKAKEWRVVTRHIRNTENNHECYISAQDYNGHYWNTKRMHLI